MSPQVILLKTPSYPRWPIIYHFLDGPRFPAALWGMARIYLLLPHINKSSKNKKPSTSVLNMGADLHMYAEH